MPNTFPFYDAEPYWPKSNQGGSGDGSGDGSGSAATTDFYIFVDSFDTAALVLTIRDKSSG